VRSALIGPCCAVIALFAGACSSDDATRSGSTVAQSTPARTVPVPAERLTPFCTSIADLDARLNAAPTGADTTQMIVEAYSAMVDDVPAEIHDDFLTVLAALQAAPAAAATLPTAPDTALTTPPPSLSSSATTSPGVDEGYLPDGDASSRLNAYIDFACRDSQNNPGPADTEPAHPPPSSTVP